MHPKKLATLHPGNSAYSLRGVDKRFVCNVSPRELSHSETSVLARRQSLNLITRKLLLSAVVASIEDGRHGLDQSTREQARLKAIGVISKAFIRKPPIISTEENQALRRLTEDENIVLLQADEGNAIVVLGKEKCDQNVLELFAWQQYIYSLAKRSDKKCANNAQQNTGNHLSEILRFPQSLDEAHLQR